MVAVTWIDREVVTQGHNISFTGVHKNALCTVCGMWPRHGWRC